MPIAIRAGQSLNRRQLLVRSAATCAVAGLGSVARPYLSRAADRPLITSGIQSGDVSAHSAVIWARADRAARERGVRGPGDGDCGCLLPKAMNALSLLPG